MRTPHADGPTRYYIDQYGSPEFDYDDKHHVKLGVYPARVADQ